MKTKYFVLTALLVTGVAFARGGGSGGHGGYSGYSSHSSGYGHSSMPSYGTGTKSEHEHVSGYTKHDGTYVAPHERSTGDHTKNNNWSTKGNDNPYTGQPGTKRGDD